MRFEFRQHRVAGQGSRIDEPGVGNRFLQGQKGALAHFPAPEILERLEPKEREPELFLQGWFEGRGDLE